MGASTDCRSCDFTAANPTELAFHAASNHMFVCLYECKHCSAQFNLKESVIFHMLQKHLKVLTKYTGKNNHHQITPAAARQSQGKKQSGFF